MNHLAFTLFLKLIKILSYFSKLQLFLGAIEYIYIYE